MKGAWRIIRGTIRTMLAWAMLKGARLGIVRTPAQLARLRHAMLLALLPLAAGCIRQRSPALLLPDASLIGQQFVGSLHGTTTRVARLISTPGDHEYAIHHVDSPRGERLFVTRLVGRTVAGPRYEILAALVPPRRRSNEVLAVSACTLDGVSDVDIVALARREPKAELSNIRAAWRASGPLASLAPLAPTGIVCEHEGWRAP